MKKICTLITFAIFCCYGYAQTRSAVEKEIRRLEQLAVKGVVDHDTSILRQVWSAEFMVNTPRNDIAENRADVFTNMRAGLIDYSSFERNIESMQIHKKMVITMGNEIFVARTDLPEVKAGQSVRRRFTNVWMKEKGEWKQVARHASVICQK